MKTLYLANTLLIIPILMALSCSQNPIKQEASVNTDSIAKVTTESMRIQKEKTLHDFLVEQIKIIENGFPGEQYKSTTDLLAKELLLFSSWVTAINEAEATQGDDFKTLSNKLKKLTIATQKSEFPKMRVAHAKITAEAMWEHDIYANTSGIKNSYLNMTGGFFAANVNIKDTQEIIGEFAKKLRFKRVQYRWYKGASEFTYYTLDTPNDNELLIIK